MTFSLRNTLLSSLIAASLGLAAASTTLANDDQSTDRTAGQVVDDVTITATIKAKLLDDERTQGFDINVDTAKGRVTLRGGADTVADRAVAEDIARQTTGVIAVDNQIVVATPGTEARDSANQATASGEVREAAKEAGEGMSTMGEGISDTWITTKVKASLLADEDIAGMSIEVTTTDKTVYLTGSVASDMVRTEAVRIAQTTEGVTRVDATALTVSNDPATTR